MTVYFLSFPLAFVLYGRKKYWLISEVDFDARDNGICFFRFLNDNHPDINCVYLISKRNNNYNLANDIGNTVEPHSYKHILLFISSKVKISTFVHGCSPSWCITKYLIKHHGTGKNVALKHGIFKNLHPNYFKENAHLDLICCGAKPEYEFIEQFFGYEKGVAQYTGLARFDLLHFTEKKNEVFVMPTWRRWLDTVKNVDEFTNSAYYNNWIGLLKNPEFLKIVSDSGMVINFYIHPKLNKYLECFKDVDNVVFLNSIEGDSIQEHLRNSSILITDFSSVFFDYAYMKKPAIYFQFDEEQYYESHYIKAYFDYRKNGFGPVVKNISQVVFETKNIIANNCQLSECYLKRVDSFFPVNDTNNCTRIFNSIMALNDSFKHN